jgi:hypothetical protein
MTQKLFAKVLVGAVLAAAWFVSALAPRQSEAWAQEKKAKNPEEGKKGTAIGVLVKKTEKSIEVRADGEEKARLYVPQWKGGMPAAGGGPDKEMLKIFRELKVGSRVEVKWVFEERLRALEVKVLAPPKGDKKEAPGKEAAGKEVKKGSVTGVLTAKGKNFIEVRGDGEEAARKYLLHFGGTKKLLDAISSTPIGARVRIEWIHAEHFRVIELEALRPADKN